MTVRIWDICHVSGPLQSVPHFISSLHIHPSWEALLIPVWQIRKQRSFSLFTSNKWQSRVKPRIFGEKSRCISHHSRHPLPTQLKATDKILWSCGYLTSVATLSSTVTCRNTHRCWSICHYCITTKLFYSLKQFTLTLSYHLPILESSVGLPLLFSFLQAVSVIVFLLIL